MNRAAYYKRDHKVNGFCALIYDYADLGMRKRNRLEIAASAISDSPSFSCEVIAAFSDFIVLETQCPNCRESGNYAEAYPLSY